VLTSIRHQDVEVPANPLDLSRSGAIIVLVRRIELQHVKIVVSLGEVVQLCGLGWISSSGVDDDVGTLQEGLDEAESEAAVGAGDWGDGRDRVSGVELGGLSGRTTVADDSLRYVFGRVVGC
jgi:hypothetical protein